MILDKYAWTNRLVILITHKEDTNLEKQVKRFFGNQVCDIDDRKLNLLHFHTNGPAVTQLPKTMQSKTGLWLLGYDGLVKDISEDGFTRKHKFQNQCNTLL